MTWKRVLFSLAAVGSMAAALCLSAPTVAAHGKQTGTKWPTSSALVAAAVGCSGHGCDDQDPIAEGCTSNAFLQEQVNSPSGYGYIQNWWSASCGTNWTVIQANSGYRIGIAGASWCSVVVAPGKFCIPSGGTVKDLADTDLWHVCSFVGTTCHQHDIPQNTTHWYTNMWYSPSGTSVESFGTFSIYGQTGDPPNSDIFTNYH